MGKNILLEPYTPRWGLWKPEEEIEERLAFRKRPGKLSFLQRTLEIAAAEQRFWKALSP